MESSGQGDGGDAAGRRAYRMSARAEAVERTRTAILQATYDLWLALPYDDVTIDAIAERAGVSRQTVHRQFGSKDELVVAVTRWRGPGEDAERAVPAGDTAAAVRRVIERNEVMGDANIRALELEHRVDAIDHMLAQGRTAHRRWVVDVFGPLLPSTGSGRDRAVDALFAATDVTIWKLLRRDLDRSVAETEEVMQQLVRGVIDQHGANSEDRT